jgi:hypothetical protein
MVPFGLGREISLPGVKYTEGDSGKEYSVGMKE